MTTVIRFHPCALNAQCIGLSNAQIHNEMEGTVTYLLIGKGGCLADTGVDTFSPSPMPLECRHLSYCDTGTFNQNFGSWDW